MVPACSTIAPEAPEAARRGIAESRRLTGPAGMEDRMAKGVAIPPFIRGWIQRSYETNPHITLEEIARHAGCTASAVTHMARRRGWTRAGRGAPVSPAAMLAAPAAERRMLLDALWLVASRHVGELQAAGVEATADGAHDLAQGTRTLMTVVRTVEKLMEMEAEAAEAARAVPYLDEGPADIDEFRNEIARRLEAMLGVPPGG